MSHCFFMCLISKWFSYIILLQHPPPPPFRVHAYFKSIYVFFFFVVIELSIHYAFLAVASCWWGHVCRSVQPRSHSSCLQHQKEKQGRRNQHLLGWYLPSIHLLHQTRVHGDSGVYHASRRRCYSINEFQDKEKEVLIQFHSIHLSCFQMKSDRSWTIVHWACRMDFSFTSLYL